MVTSLFCKLLFCLIFIYLFKKKREEQVEMESRVQVSFTIHRMTNLLWSSLFLKHI